MPPPFTIGVQNKALRLARVLAESGVSHIELEMIDGDRAAGKMWAKASEMANVGTPSKTVRRRTIEILRGELAFDNVN